MAAESSMLMRTSARPLWYVLSCLLAPARVRRAWRAWTSSNLDLATWTKPAATNKQKKMHHAPLSRAAVIGKLLGPYPGGGHATLPAPVRRSCSPGPRCGRRHAAPGAQARPERCRGGTGGVIPQITRATDVFPCLEESKCLRRLQALAVSASQVRPVPQQVGL
jgi:hypothetical protein